MTVNIADAERRTRYTPSVSTTTFAVGFPIVAAADLQVWDDVVLVDVSDYNVTLGALVDGFYSAASVVFDTGVTGTIDIVGARAPERTSPFQEGQPVPASLLNQELARQTLERREAYDRSLRTLSFAPGASQIALPAPEANKVLGWDPTGVFLINAADITNVIGATGATGPAGAVGATGATGAAGPGSGDVLGGGAVTDNALARYDDTSGTMLQPSLLVITDAGALSGFTNKTGLDANIVTGTKGAGGRVAMWNADGDAVDAGFAAANVLLDADIGGSVQAQDDLLDAIAALSMVAGRYVYGTGTGAVALGMITSAMRTLLTKSSVAGARSYLSAAAKSQTQEGLPLFVKTVENETQENVWRMPHGGTITAIWFMSKSGTVTFRLRKNGGNLGSSRAVTTSNNKTTGLSDTFAANDRLGYKTSSNSSCLGMGIMVFYTRAYQ